MDYKSYKAHCDSTLQQIRKSENKREELNNKLQKMYQEKSECEKSIIKTLESQQKQFMEEKRKRAERNENILRTLERIDYQAQLLAAKSKRLRALKKQYERYLLSLWATRRVAVYPTSSSTYSTARPFTAKYEELPIPIHQSSTYSGVNSNYLLNNPNVTVPAPHFNSTSPLGSSSIAMATAPYSHYNNQSLRYVYGDEVPLTSSVGMSALENSIKSGNYHQVAAPTAATAGLSSYPSSSSLPYQVRYDYVTQMPLLPPSYQTDDRNDKKSFHLSNDNAINIGEMNIPPTINSIYSQHQLMPHLPLDEKSSSSVHQRNNQPLESSMKVSRAFHANPLITSPTQATDLFQPQFSSSFENRLKNDTQQPTLTDDTDDVESEGSETLTKLKKPTDTKSIKIENDDDESMHQVWEKRVIETTIDDAEEQEQHHFVIPKIIVETQIDLTESIAMASAAPATTIMDENIEKQDRDIPEKLLNQTSFEMEKHSGDNRQNGSLSSTSAPHNNSPLTAEEGVSTIYHYDKQPVAAAAPQLVSSDEQQQQTYQQPQSSVDIDYELRNFNDIKISHDNDETAAPMMTCDSEINSNNSLTEGAINNINDDKNVKISPSQPQTSTSAVLNDKISEIYRKIEKIEGEYYGEKGKIMENFDRRLSATSLNDEAKIEAQTMENKYDDANTGEEDLSCLQQSTNADIILNNDMQQQQQQEQIYVGDENQENLIFENQSECIEKNQEMQSSQRDTQSNYNFHHQNFINETGEEQQQQKFEYLESSNLNQEEQEEEIFVNETNPNNGELQATSIEQHSYEPSSSTAAAAAALQYQTLEQQQQEDYIYSHQQQQQQQNDSEIGNYNQYQQQFDLNYQQNNNYETIENSTDYANDQNGAVYYDYDNSSQNYATDASQAFYDEANYTHQQPVEYQSNVGDVEASQTNEYFYQPDTASSVLENIEGNVYHQDQSNESNYDTTSTNRQENFIETSNEMNSVYDTNANEYQSSTTDGSYSNMEQYHRDTQMPLENANFDTQHLVLQAGNENYEQQQQQQQQLATMRDDEEGELVGEGNENYQTTSSDASSSSMMANTQEIIEGKESSVVVVPSTKRDDVKLVKQLLDSESDDTTSRSNLLKTAIKEEEADESDFDFSTN